MSALGASGEIPIGDKSTVQVGSGVTLNLKNLYRLRRGRPAERDGTASGPQWSFGALDGRFIVDVVASTPDLSTIDGWNNRTAAGDLTEKTTIVTFVPDGGGGSVTATFTAKYNVVEIGHFTPEGKVFVHLEAVITSETITWG